MSKQVTKGHVRDAVHMYLVNRGAGLTKNTEKDPAEVTYTVRLMYPLTPRLLHVCVKGRT
jgi:hypothetical protein